MCIEFRASLLSDLLQYSDAAVFVVNMSLTWHKKLKLSRTLCGSNTSSINYQGSSNPLLRLLQKGETLHVTRIIMS